MSNYNLDRESYRAELALTRGEQILILRDRYGRIYSKFNLAPEIVLREKTGFEYAGFVKKPKSENHEEFVLTYVPRERAASNIESEVVHVIFGDDEIEYGVALKLGASGSPLSVEAIHYFRGSLHYFSELFTPQPNLNDKREFKAHQGFKVSAKQTPDQHGDGGQWQFTPPPYALGMSLDELSHEWLMAGLMVRPGHYNFNSMDYIAENGTFAFFLDFGGHETVHEKSWESPGILMRFARDPYVGIEEYRKSLTRKKLVPEPRGLETMPTWWKDNKRPIFTTWGAQVAESSKHRSLTNLYDATGAPEYSTQKNVEKWVGELCESGIDPGIVIIDDQWAGGYDSLEPDPVKWPDMRDFINLQHHQDRKVILWFGLFRDSKGNIHDSDPTSKEFESDLRRKVRRAVSVSGLDADGFKVDFTANVPGIRHSTSNPGIAGTELLHHYIRIIYEEAKESKKDALMIAHTANPYFLDVVDMLRLNDIGADPKNIVKSMTHRANIAAAAGFNLIDSDQWPVVDRDSWLDYVKRQSSLLPGKRSVLTRASLYYVFDLPTIQGCRVSIRDLIPEASRMLQKTDED